MLVQERLIMPKALTIFDKARALKSRNVIVALKNGSVIRTKVKDLFRVGRSEYLSLDDPYSATNCDDIKDITADNTTTEVTNVS